MHCTNCGQELAEGVRFCANCGAPVAAVYEEPAPQPEPGPAPAPPAEENTVNQGAEAPFGEGYQQAPEPPYAQGYQQAPEEHIQPRPEQQSYTGEQKQSAPNDTKAIVSLVCGVIAIITMFTGGGALIGIVAAIVGLVFGIKARKENPSTMATVGIILCALSLVLCALVFIGCLACLGTGIATGAGSELSELLNTL